MFPLDVANTGRLNVAVVGQTPAELWHLKFGHLNYRSLQLLAQKNMVVSIPELKQDTPCEDCVLANKG